MTTFPAAGGRFREERDPWWFVVDPLLILSVMAITAMGALLVYSATRGPATELDPADTSFLTRQVLFAVVGAGFGLFAALINIERIRSLVGVAYIATLGLLFGVVLFGADINGTQAWYRVAGFTFQPSEPGKLVLIIPLATVFSGERVGFPRMAAGLLLAGVPIGLILLQPDLGTVLVYIVITAVMITMSNISMRLILLLVLAAITGITMIFTSDVLEDYQKDRLTVFVLDDEAVAELGADAECPGLLEDLLFPLEVAVPVTGRCVTRGRQVVEIVRRGVFGGLQRILRRRAADDEGEEQAASPGAALGSGTAAGTSACAAAVGRAGAAP